MNGCVASVRTSTEATKQLTRAETAPAREADRVSKTCILLVFYSVDCIGTDSTVRAAGNMPAVPAAQPGQAKAGLSFCAIIAQVY